MLRQTKAFLPIFYLPGDSIPGIRQAEASSNQHPNREMLHLPTPAPTIWKLDLYLLLNDPGCT